MNQPDWIRRLTACRERELKGDVLPEADLAFMSKIDVLLELLPDDFSNTLLALGLGATDEEVEVTDEHELLAAASCEVWPLVREAVEGRDNIVRVVAGGEEIAILELFPEARQAKPVYIDGWEFEVVDQGQTTVVSRYGGLVISFESLQQMILDRPTTPGETKLVRLRTP